MANVLVVFNLFLGVQTVIDVFFPYGGTTLPDNMTMPPMVRRGAYPLLATALVAGAFALANRSFVAKKPGLRWLMLAYTNLH